MPITRQDAINDALDRLKGRAFTMEPGFAEHGPMVAETVSALERNDRVAAYVSAYQAQRKPMPAPPSRQTINGSGEAAWREALGDAARMTDWLEFFRHRLAESPWRDVLRAWVPMLIGGYAGGLTHGLIRTAHAVRGLPETASPTPLQIDELAHALAYWAGGYRTVTGDAAKSGELDLAEALRQLPRVVHDKPMSPFALANLRMDALAGFEQIVDGLAPIADVDAAIHRHAALFARVLIAHPELRPVPMIALIHAITAPIALRNLLPLLPEEFAARAYRQAWLVSAALAAQVAGPPHKPEVDGEIPGPKLARDELIERALAHGDEHVIKLTEAMLREDKIRADPAFRVAAETALQKLPPWPRP
jgi:hypothetical protein